MEKVRLIEAQENSDVDLENKTSTTIQNSTQHLRTPKPSPFLQYVHAFSLVFLTIQQILQPLFVRKAHHEAEKAGSPVIASTIVLVTEIIRLTICCLQIIGSQKSITSFMQLIWDTFTQNKRETLKVCVPALIYLIQNNLYYVALKLLDATLFSITYQLRILTTAILMVLIMRKVFSKTQWGALFISLAGVVCVQISSRQVIEQKGQTKADHGDYIFGLTVVFIMCWMSGFAGVFLEKVFKKSSCDIWLQNIRLSIITLPFAVLSIARDHEILEKNGFFYGWTTLVWIIAFSSAVGGVMVSVVMKYADNIKKSYCQSIALGGTALISVFVGDSKPTALLFIGVGLVILSVFLYSLFPPTELTKLQSIVEIRFPQKLKKTESSDFHQDSNLNSTSTLA